jgi:AraC family transcriptional regulator of adaptative response/methylated-DNA-[protein]-cysteine methyltransferase
MKEMSTRSAPHQAESATCDTIEYTIGNSLLGQILVARGALGVYAILIGSDTESLRQQLAESFPDSRLAPNDIKLRKELAQVLQFVMNPSEGLDPVLDMRGTAYQRRVWNALRAVPAVTTVSYTELARRVGDAKLARAVASACAANALALAVPCHRVVRSDGSLSGYRRGVDRKRDLIDKEART